MSIEAPNWYTIQYDQKVSHLLQNEGFLLRGTTASPVNVKGNTLEFFFIGKGTAQPFGATPELAVAANLAKTTKTVDMTDWQFFELVRHGEPDKISPEYRGAIQEAGSMALGRKFDRLIMEAMDGDGGIATIGDGSAAISPITLSTAKANINSVGMMKMNEFYCPLPSISWEALMLYKVFNNADYTGDHPFMNNSNARTWNGIHFFQMPDDAFTVPSGGGTSFVDTYLWNRRMVGFGSNYALNTKITYENMYTSWAYNSVMSGAAKVLQPAGVKRLRIKIDGALAIN